MRSFLKMFFASFFAMLLLLIIAVIVVIGLVAGAASSKKPNVGEKAVLVLDLTKEYKEQKEENPVNVITGNANENAPGLYDIVRMIKFAKSDSSVKGIYIKSEDNQNGFAASQELRRALADFKMSHKFVIAYGDYISQKAYYVSSIADKIYCNPVGTVEWTGLSSTLFFLKGTLEKLKIEPQIFYAGKFKSATEPLRAYEMTEPNRIQTTAYLQDLYSHVLLAASAKSHTDTATLHMLANTGAILSASDAVKHKLIDDTRYDDQVKTEIIKYLNIGRTKKINFVTMGKYARAVDFTPNGDDKIALIYAEGEIVDGDGTTGEIGSDKYRQLIRKARLDDDIKAIVFRVNSPGGSVIASEEIWRELSIAKKDKPVIVSFGDVAASGGYYVSCNADSIFAQPNTITGSIGVFGIIPNMKQFFNDKLGVTFDAVKTGPYADMPAISRPLSPQEKAFIQASIDSIYVTFKTRVANGRNLPLNVVDSIAQGRVWTGERALALGLIDKLGNIDDAVKSAARMAKLTSYRLKEYPEKKNFLENLIENYSNEVKVKAIKEEIGSEQYTLLQQLKSIKASVGIPQARLPFNITTK